MLTFPSLSIRTTLSLLVSAMGGLLVAGSAALTLDSLAGLREANRIEVIGNASRTLFRTFTLVRIERGTFIATTTAAAPADKRELERITTHRGLAEDGYRDIIWALTDVQIPGLPEALGHLLESHEQLDELRRRIDWEILKPKAQRPPGIEMEAAEVPRIYVEALSTLGTLLETTLQTEDPVAFSLLSIKRTAWAARNYSGLLALRIERAAAGGESWTADDVTAATQDAAQAAFAWNEVKAALQRPDTPPALRGLIGKGQKYFSGPNAEERKAMIATLSGGGTIAMPIRDLQNRNTAEVDGFVRIAERAMDELVTRADARHHHAVRALALSSVVALLAMSLVAISSLHVYRRISKPLDVISRVMKQLVDLHTTGSVPGKADETPRLTALEIPYVGRSDEIGDTARALELLRNSLIDKQRLAEQERQKSEQLRRAELGLIAAEKLAALGRLVAGIAHELNTPIGSALTVASTLKEVGTDMTVTFAGGQGRLQKRDLESFLERVTAAADIQITALSAAATLVRNFKQVAVDQTAERRRPFDLGELVEQVASTLRPMFKHTPFEIVTAVDNGIVMDSFPGSLGQVLSNLIVNAVIHGLEGRERGTVTVSARMNDGMVDIAVADDGAGILPEHLPHIFEPFYTTKFGKGGSGLGLSIVYNLTTAALGGTIAVKTAANAGTTFSMRFPVEWQGNQKAPEGLAS